MSLRELHLFAGIGGGILGGMLLGHKCVGAVEIDPYCRKVLEARQNDGSLGQFPIFEDVRTFDGKPWRGRVDVVCGGFPCQPWSQAGKRLGAADPRHLWPEMFRIVSETRPRWVFAENVSLAAFAEPWRDLRGLGYRVPPALRLGARDVGAPHLRNRWWLLAADADCIEHESGASAERGETSSELSPDADGQRQPQHGRSVQEVGRRLGDVGPTLADTGGAGLPLPECQAIPRAGRRQERRAATERSWWAIEPDVGRVAHGVPARVHRLRGLGNAQVPLQAATAFSELMARHFGTEATA